MGRGPSKRAMPRTEVDVTAGAVTGLAAGFASLPSWTLDENQLADLEMLLSGVFAPLTGFMTASRCVGGVRVGHARQTASRGRSR